MSLFVAVLPGFWALIPTAKLGRARGGFLLLTVCDSVGVGHQGPARELFGGALLGRSRGIGTVPLFYGAD